MQGQLTKQSGGGGGSSFDESKHPRVPKGQTGGGRFGSSGGGGLAADQKALNRAKRNAGQGGGHKRKPTAVQVDRAALAAAQQRARANPKDKGAKRAVTAAKKKLRHTVAAERKKRKHAALEARKRARAQATAARKAARAQASAQKKAQRAAQKGTKTNAPKLPKSVKNAPPSTTLSPATIGKLRQAGLSQTTLSSLLRSKGKNAALLNTLAAGASRPFGAWTAGLAKASSSGSSGSAFNPSKHPRAAKGGPTGGQFITAGQQTAPAKGAAKRLGAGNGPLTQQQITAFQQAHGLKVDGLIGQQTAAALLGQGPQAPGSITQAQLQALGAGVPPSQTTKPKGSKPAGSSSRSTKAPVAKQTVAISDPGSGQTMTIDANRLGMYRKLRRKGLSHMQAMALCKRAGIAKAKYVARHPPIIHHGKINWVDRVGGLPGPIDAIARVLISHGWDESTAVATAVSQAKKQCATGLAAGGHIHLGGEARATICAAVASWEAKKAAA